MVQAINKKLTLQEFLALPEGDVTYELVNGEAIAKISAKRFHSKVAVALCLLLTAWAQERGEVGIEWAIVLKRENQDWAAVPDLLYISYALLPKEPVLDEACPVPRNWLLKSSLQDKPLEKWLRKQRPICLQGYCAFGL